jgi:hypothetical protein
MLGSSQVSRKHPQEYSSLVPSPWHYRFQMLALLNLASSGDECECLANKQTVLTKLNAAWWSLPNSNLKVLKQGGVDSRSHSHQKSMRRSPRDSQDCSSRFLGDNLLNTYPHRAATVPKPIVRVFWKVTLPCSLTSGTLILLLVSACLRPPTQLHVFTFNRALVALSKAGEPYLVSRPELGLQVTVAPQLVHQEHGQHGGGQPQRPHCHPLIGQHVPHPAPQRLLTQEVTR